MNFGEGGAGAYTDGKLSTRINHPWSGKSSNLRPLRRAGAHPGRRKPHIGSDLLPFAVARLREELVAGGCQVRFEARVEDVLSSEGVAAGVLLHDRTRLDSDRVVLAPGNSARELFERFAVDGRVAIEAKPFAIGFRAEHPQGLIDAIQYGAAAHHPELPPADYKLAENFETGGEMRGVYSFCMCPGGLIVPTPTEDGLQCTNGMSNSRRNARYANAGIVVSVSPADFARAGFHGPLAGLEFQRHWEQEAYRLGGGAVRRPGADHPPTTSPAGRGPRPATPATGRASPTSI
jgi:uncharacterized FAD-dependent dehydrogenase